MEHVAQARHENLMSRSCDTIRQNVPFAVPPSTAPLRLMAKLPVYHITDLCQMTIAPIGLANRG
ncbi:hypothetical protein LMTR3_21320 [Bradyrhizobium sp. LMTR 3]|nr:hypothetical protein LMTR3_21320 [Bradyrhizobium sp. LMTR 3]